jgi:hypothetical protein
LFDRWDGLVGADSARVRRECALYRRWLTALDPADEDSLLVREVVLEMLAEIMVDATLAE